MQTIRGQLNNRTKKFINTISNLFQKTKPKFISNLPIKVKLPLGFLLVISIFSALIILNLFLNSHLQQTIAQLFENNNQAIEVHSITEKGTKRIKDIIDWIEKLHNFFENTIMKSLS